MDRIYCVRDKSTGKLVSNLTNPKKKFWQKRKSAEDAARYPNRNVFKGDKENLEVVEYELKEINSWSVLKLVEKE